MNFRLPSSASVRTACERALSAALLLWLVCFGPAFAQTTSAGKPEYIVSPPDSQVVSDADPYSLTVVFAWNETGAVSEPPAAKFPVVKWYVNGNYVGPVTSVIKNKTIFAGAAFYDCYDPYGDGGAGQSYPFFTPDGKDRQIVWSNTYKVAAGGATAVYTAKIEVLGDVVTPPAQVVVTPAQTPGGVKPTLTIVRSPESASKQPGGAVRFWGDAFGHVNGLIRSPTGVAVDSQGMVYVADTLNHGIRRLTPGGRGLTVAGLDGVILEKGDAKRIFKTTNYDPVVATVTASIVSGQTRPSVLKLSSVAGIAKDSRLVYTGSQSALVKKDGSQGTIPPTLIVNSVDATAKTVTTTEAVEAGSLSGTGVIQNSGTLTFSVKDNKLGRAVFKERAALSGSALPSSLGSRDRVDLISIQDPNNVSSYRYQTEAGYASGTTNEPLFNAPEALTTADDNSVYIADTDNNAIRRLYTDAEGQTHVQTIISGSLLYSYNPLVSMGTWGGKTYSNSSALANKQFQLVAPRGIVFDTSTSITDTTGTKSPVIYVLDFNSIKKITLCGGPVDGGTVGCVQSVSYIGNIAQATGSLNGRLFAPRGLVVTREDEGRVPVLYVADTVNHVIRKLSLPLTKGNSDTASPASWVSEVVAGLVGAQATQIGSGADGNTGYYPPVAIASCYTTSGGSLVTMDSTTGIQASDTLTIGTYLATTVKRVVSKTVLEMNGTATATTPVKGGAPGILSSRSIAKANIARLSYPAGLAMDDYRNLYFTEMGSHDVRRVVLDSVNPGVSARIETVAGTGRASSIDFNYPASIAYDSTGADPSFVVADSANHVIRRVTRKTVTLPSITGTASLANPNVITVSSTAGLQKLMPVSGKDVCPGSVITAVNSVAKTITVSLPVGQAFADQTLAVTQDTFTTAAILGYPGVQGNRDFASECSEYTYQWLKYGKVITDRAGDGSLISKISGVGGPFLYLTNLQEMDAGPYALSIVNPFNVTAETNQAALYVTPAIDSNPTFQSPGYAMLSAVDGSELQQIRSDVTGGVVDLALQAYVTPSDVVSYQWQVYNGTLSAGTIAGTEADWVSLADTRNSQNLKAAPILGVSGSGGFTLNGTTTSKLKIGGFQKSLITERNQAIAAGTIPKPLPPAFFRVLCLPLDGGTLGVTLDEKALPQVPFQVQASYAPIITNSEVFVQVTADPDQPGASFPITRDPVDSQVTFTGAAKRLSLVAAGSLSIDSFPFAGGEQLNPGIDPSADPYPGVRAQYQWMVSSKAPSSTDDLTVKPAVDAFGNAVSGDCSAGVQDCAVDFDPAGLPQFYFLRFWVGSGGYADAATRIGNYVNGSYVKLSPEVQPAPAALAYADGAPLAPEPSVKIVSVNAPTQSFTLSATVDSAFGKPTFTWDYLKWGTTTWRKIYVGTLASGTSGIVLNTSQSISVGGASDVAPASVPAANLEPLGTGKIDQSLTLAKLSLDSFTKEVGAAGANKDLSGIYRLTANVEGSNPTYLEWVVAARQKPYPRSSSAYTITGGSSLSSGSYKENNNSPGSVAIVDLGLRQTVTMGADVVFPLPDTLPMDTFYNTIYGGIANDPDRPFTAATDKYQTAADELYSWIRGAVPIKSGTITALSGGTLIADRGTLTVAGISKSSLLGVYSLNVSNVCGTETNLGPDPGSGSQKGWAVTGNGLPEFTEAFATAKSTAGSTLVSFENGLRIQRVAEGQPVALEAAAVSSYPLKYAWKYKTTAGGSYGYLASYLLKTGATTATVVPTTDSKYLIRSAKLADTGFYQAQVWYTRDRVTTLASGLPELFLLVEPLPNPAAPVVKVNNNVVKATGTSRVLVYGSTAVLSAVSATTSASFIGSPGSQLATRFFAFQWRKNGVAIVGETNETLTLSSVSKAQAGSYTVDVSGVAGTRTSAATLVSVAATAISKDVLWPLAVEAPQDIKYTVVPTATSGLAAGTAVTLNGMSSSSQTLLGWRLWDASGQSWELPARNAKFIMPNNAVSVAAILGRPSIGMYSGFLSLEKPWNELEWVKPDATNLPTPSTSSVRGYFTAMVNSLGTLSGKVLVEGKSYPFTSAMNFAADGTLTGPIQIQAPLLNGTAWRWNGTASLNLGLRIKGVFTEDPTVIQVDPADLAGLALGMSVSAQGLPASAIITEIDTGGSITVSAPSTNPNGTRVIMTVGANVAATENVMHVTLADVVLEKTPPKMTSGQTLYCSAASNAGAYKAMQKFITAQTYEPAPTEPRFTVAIYRYGIKDAASCFGRSGVLSASVSNLGLATVTGWLPNGARLTYSGYIGRACLVTDDKTPDPVQPFVSNAKEKAKLDAMGSPKDVTGTAAEIMQETLIRQTSSISIPIWSTSPAGDSPAEPLFGALVMSELNVEGCLGVLNSAPVLQSGLEISASEYTHNYARGYLYDPTLIPGWPKADPYTPTAKVILSTNAPGGRDTATFPLEETTDPTVYGTGTSMGLLTGNGSGFVFAISPTASASKPAILLGSEQFTLDSTTGLLTGSYTEQTNRYVSSTTRTGPSWAYTTPLAEEPKVKSIVFKTSIGVRIYAVSIQAGENAAFSTAGGAAGFLMRGTTALDSLKNVLGNGAQDPFLQGANATYRTEGFNVKIYEPN